MANEIIIDIIGCFITVNQDFLQITKDQIAVYEKAGMPQPNVIYRAWDNTFRAILAANAAIETLDFDTVSIGGGNAQTLYQFNQLIDAIEILQVKVNGIELKNTGTGVMAINTVTGEINYPGAMVDQDGNGQNIQILYKSAPVT